MAQALVVNTKSKALRIGDRFSGQLRNDLLNTNIFVDLMGAGSLASLWWNE